MNISEWVLKIHQCALDHGWWVDKEEDLKNMTPEARLAKHMLIVTEISEASESVRMGEPPWLMTADGKHEGEAVELADAVIRIMDYFGFMNWDLEAIIEAKYKYNMTREFRHGGKAL